MLRKLTTLLSKVRNARPYYWKGFLVKIGLSRDRISVKTRKIPGTQTKAGHTCEIITRNERTKEERKTKAIVFSQEAVKKIRKAKADLDSAKH